MLLSKHEAAEKVAPPCWDRFVALGSSSFLPGCSKNETLHPCCNKNETLHRVADLSFHSPRDRIACTIAAVAGIVPRVAHALPIKGYSEDTETTDA